MKSSLFTVPNVLTFSRFILAFVLYYLIIKKNLLFSVIILAIILLTDILDGFFARKLNQVSKFGAVFDPIIDTIFIVVTLFALLYSGMLTIYLFIFLLFPRFFTFLVIIYLKYFDYSASKYSKIASLFTYLAIFSLLVGFSFILISIFAVIIYLFLLWHISYMIKMHRK